MLVLVWLPLWSCFWGVLEASAELSTQAPLPTCRLRAGLARGELLSCRKVSTSWFCLLLLEPLHPFQLSPLGSASVCPHPVSPTVLVRSLCGLKCHRSAAVLGFSCVHSCTFTAEPRSAWLAFVWAMSLVRGIFTSSLSGHFRVLHHLASLEEHACEPHTALLSSF